MSATSSKKVIYAALIGNALIATSHYKIYCISGYWQFGYVV